MRKQVSIMALAAAVLIACGGGDEDAFKDPGTPPPGGGNPPPSGPTVSNVTLVTNAPSMPSDDSVPAQLSAYVRDANNNFVPNILVQFSADSGGLSVTQPTTDSNGLATAVLNTLNDPARRTITVTATANGVSDTVTIDVTGTQMSIQGPSALVNGQQGTYTVILSDAGNSAIAGESVSVTSQNGNTLSASSLTTDSTGRATFTLTAANSGSDTLTASAVGVTGTANITVNSDNFAFTSPAANAEVALSTPQSLTVRWMQNGVPVVNQPVGFATTRGTLSAASANTNVNGEATVSIQATNAGTAVITASAAGGTSTQHTIEFVATTAATIDVQPSAFSLGTNESSTLTAIVRDPSNNLVKNKTVVFTLDDISGGTLTVGTAVTDSLGRAQTIYRSSSATSGNNGVVITATVQGTAISDSVALTVARRELFVRIGTGNSIVEVNEDTEYRMDFTVRVTDANGSGVANVPVSLSILSEYYHKGYRGEGVNSTTGQPSGRWTTYSTARCADEDTLIPETARNGVLDGLAEDVNSSGEIEAGNVASVSPGNAVTDNSGFVLVSIFYPQEYGEYLEVALAARTSVQGTEFGDTSRFLLPVAASDFQDLNTAPPGPVSPWGLGVSGSCTIVD